MESGSKHEMIFSSLEEYISFRKINPDKDVVSNFLFDDIAWVHRAFFLGEKLEQYGLGASEIFQVLNGDIQTINLVWVRLLEEIVKERKAKKIGKTHLRRENIIPVDLREYLLSICVLSVFENRLTINYTIVAAIVEQLGGLNGRRIDEGLIKQSHRHAALVAAARMILRGEEPGVRSVAKEIGVAPSTITRLFPDNSLQQQAAQIAAQPDVLERMEG